jgi:hypothetical protein
MFNEDLLYREFVVWFVPHLFAWGLACLVRGVSCLSVDSQYTARQDTTRQKPPCIEIYPQLTDTTCRGRHRQAKYSLLSIPTTLSLSLAVGDGLVWIRACENHKRIFRRVVLCRIMWIDPKRVNSPYNILLRQRRRAEISLYSAEPRRWLGVGG